MDLKNLIMKLSSAEGFGEMGNAVSAVREEIEKYADEVYDDGSCVTAFIKGKSEKTIMFDAHIDEVGFVVTAADKNGFVKVAPAGGIDGRILAAQPVHIHGKEVYTGVFCSTPPHLSKGDEKPKKAEDMYIDTGIRDGAGELIPLGSHVTYATTPKALAGGYICGKSLDDRAGAAALIEAARLIREKGTPEYNICFLFSHSEELGCRGAKIKAFDINPDYAIAVDVGFGDVPDVPEEKSQKLGSGVMIGLSPVLSNKVCRALTKIAKDNNIPHTFDVTGGTTSTNADVIAVTKGGIACGLLSIPLRNMHTPLEVVNAEDVGNTARLLSEFAFSFEE